MSALWLLGLLTHSLPGSQLRAFQAGELGERGGDLRPGGSGAAFSFNVGKQGTRLHAQSSRKGLRWAKQEGEMPSTGLSLMLPGP